MARRDQQEVILIDSSSDDDEDEDGGGDGDGSSSDEATPVHTAAVATIPVKRYYSESECESGARSGYERAVTRTTKRKRYSEESDGGGEEVGGSNNGTVRDSPQKGVPLSCSDGDGDWSPPRMASVRCGGRPHSIEVDDVKLEEEEEGRNIAAKIVHVPVRRRGRSGEEVGRAANTPSLAAQKRGQGELSGDEEDGGGEEGDGDGEEEDGEEEEDEDRQSEDDRDEDCIGTEQRKLTSPNNPVPRGLMCQRGDHLRCTSGPVTPTRTVSKPEGVLTSRRGVGIGVASVQKRSSGGTSQPVLWVSSDDDVVSDPLDDFPPPKRMHATPPVRKASCDSSSVPATPQHWGGATPTHKPADVGLPPPPHNECLPPSSGDVVPVLPAPTLPSSDRPLPLAGTADMSELSLQEGSPVVWGPDRLQPSTEERSGDGSRGDCDVSSFHGDSECCDSAVHAAGSFGSTAETTPAGHCCLGVMPPAAISLYPTHSHYFTSPSSSSPSSKECHVPGTGPRHTLAQPASSSPHCLWSSWCHRRETQGDLVPCVGVVISSCCAAKSLFRATPCCSSHCPSLSSRSSHCPSPSSRSSHCPSPSPHSSNRSGKGVGPRW